MNGIGACSYRLFSKLYYITEILTCGKVPDPVCVSYTGNNRIYFLSDNPPGVLTSGETHFQVTTLPLMTNVEATATTPLSVLGTQGKMSRSLPSTIRERLII